MARDVRPEAVAFRQITDRTKRRKASVRQVILTQRFLRVRTEYGQAQECSGCRLRRLGSKRPLTVFKLTNVCGRQLRKSSVGQCCVEYFRRRQRWRERRRAFLARRARLLQRSIFAGTSGRSRTMKWPASATWVNVAVGSKRLLACRSEMRDQSFSP